MGELAERSHLSKQTMTELVRRLERDGLVERRPDPNDGRASLIFLTERSRSFEPVAERILAELARLTAAQLSDDRVEQLKADLLQLVRLDKREGGGRPRRGSAVLPRV